VVADGGANPGDKETRRKRTRTGYKDVVSGPLERFSRPERESVTDPIGMRLRGFCAFHCPHLLPGQALRWLDREQATPQARTGVCCLIKYDAKRGAFVPPGSVLHCFQELSLKLAASLRCQGHLFSVKELLWPSTKFGSRSGATGILRIATLKKLSRTPSTGEAICTKQEVIAVVDRPQDIEDDEKL
jgi:hypothetical protein